MKRYLNRFIVLALLLSTVSCKNMSTRTQTSEVGEIHRRPTNISYYLPKVSYEIKSIYRLNECDASVYVKDGRSDLFQQLGINSLGVVDGKPDVKTTYTLIQKYGSEYSTLFTLDTEQLSTGRQDQNVTISLHENGTLKSINSTVTDQTGTIFTSVLKFLTNIVGIGNISDAPFTMQSLQALQSLDQDDRPGKINLCKSDVQKALAEVKKNNSDLTVLKKMLRDLKLDSGDPRVIKDRFDVIDKKIAVLTARSDYLKSKELTIEYTHTIEPSVATNSHPFKPPTALLEKKWFNSKALHTLESSIDYPFLSGELYFDNIPDKVISAADAKQYDKADNMVVRRTFETTFKLCHKTCKDRGPVKPVFKGHTRVPQWADIGIIDFDAEIFENRTISLQFGADGNMTSLAFSQKSKIANAVGALSSTSGEYKSLVDARLTGEDAAEISYLDKEVKKIKLRRELETLLEPN